MSDWRNKTFVDFLYDILNHISNLLKVEAEKYSIDTINMDNDFEGKIDLLLRVFYKNNSC